jgi:hypothetical protein
MRVTVADRLAVVMTGSARPALPYNFAPGGTFERSELDSTT